MLEALKIDRAARPFGFSEDDYLDARNYNKFAEETHPLNSNRKDENKNRQFA